MGGKKIWILLTVLLVVVILAIAAGGALIYLMSRPAALAQDSLLEVSLGGTLAEVPTSDPLAMIFESERQNLWDLRLALETAAEDDQIRGVFLNLFPMLASNAQVEEVRQLIDAFQQSGKKVYAFYSLDLVTEKELYLGGGADFSAVNPTAGFLFNGLAAEVVFMKRTLEMLGIEPQFIQFKEYKSAETYTRQSLTPEIRNMLTSVLADVQNRLVETLADGRGIPVSQVESLLQQGLFDADVALENQLVDGLVYRTDLQKQMQEETGLEEYRTVSVSDYLESNPPGSSSADTKVAVLGATGTIISGKSEEFAGLMGGATVSEQLRELREDSSVDGVILRVNSPGGSVVGSDMIWKEVEELQAAGKPVVVSMSGTAASGGYYISMGADKIVSQPSTITGSIGVIFGKFDLSGLYNWIGMDIDRIRLAPNADIFSMTTSLSPEQIAQIEGWMEDVYQTFVRKAAEGRDVPYEEMEPKAQGRIYTGAQAQENGLVDALGGFSTAVAEMRAALELAEEEGLQLELYPRPKSLWESLASGDLFKLNAASRAVEVIRAELSNLERPGMWFMAPEVTVD